MNQSPIVVMAVYRVAVSKQTEMLRVIREKREYFSRVGYMTSRIPTLVRSPKNPEFMIDIFEWSSEDAIEKAHADPVVRRLWSRMEELWIDGGLGLEKLPESEEAFAGFEAVDID